MAKINDIDITSLLFQEGSAPTTPASTKWRLYFKTTGLFVREDTGTEVGPLAAATAGTTFVGARAYSSATQNISTATATAVTFGSEEYDTDTIHDTSSNTSRFTVPSGKDGKWSFNGTAFFQANATGYRYAYLRKNGTTEIRGSGMRVLSPGSGGGITCAASAVVDLVATDYVELMVEQNSGSTLTVGHASILPIMSMMEAFKVA